MAEHFFKAQPDYGRMKPEYGAHNVVRVYRAGPETVNLQLRGSKHFMTASIPFDVAQQIADALKQEAQ